MRSDSVLNIRGAHIECERRFGHGQPHRAVMTASSPVPGLPEQLVTIEWCDAGEARIAVDPSPFGVSESDLALGGTA